MKKFVFLVLCIFALFFQYSCTHENDLADREKLFNVGWKFIRSDVSGAEKIDFDDVNWRTLDLPHDYSIEDLPEREGVKQIGPFSEESAGGISTGYVVGGTAWYRKHFTIDGKFSATQGKNFPGTLSTDNPCGRRSRRNNC